MEFARRLSRVQAENAMTQLRRAWAARSDAHLRAHERAEFFSVVRYVEGPRDRLGANDILQIDEPLEDADVAIGLIERGPRFTRATFLGVAPRSAALERDGRLLVPVGAFSEPREEPPFELRAPRDLELLARIDLREEARRAAGESGREDVERLRLYLLVFCFHDDDARYAAIRASAPSSERSHLDRLRSLCSEGGLELGPQMARLRAELAREMG